MKLFADESNPTINRSTRLEVRNPMLALPAFKKLQAMEPSIRHVLADVLIELKADAAARAQKCWRTHKAPMALYWKVVAVYAGHIARALK